MGYFVHHTIGVTSWNLELLHEARAFALSIGAQVTDVAPSAINGIGSFIVGPDGSKEGWEASAAGDVRRAQFKDWLRSKAYADGSSAFAWFELEHPEDGAPRVIDHQRRRVAK